LRNHQFEEDVSIKVNEIYPVAFTTTIKDSENNPVGEITHAMVNNSNEFVNWAKRKDEESELWQIQQQLTNSDAKKNKIKLLTIRQLLLSKDSKWNHYGPEILDHCIVSSVLIPSTKVRDLLTFDEDLLKIDTLIYELDNSAARLSILLETVNPGYIVVKDKIISETSKNNNDNGNNEDIDVKEYIDFIPMIFKQHENKEVIEFPTFNIAVDEYFCKIEEQKLNRLAVSLEDTALKKIAKVKKEQFNQINNLVTKQQNMELKAMLVEFYAIDIDKLSLVINSCLSNGMSWGDIHDMVIEESKLGIYMSNYVSIYLSSCLTI
jgi:hypothetical protein